VTAKVKYMAVAASAAEPPTDKMSRPINAARGSSATTPPKKPSTYPKEPWGAAWSLEHAATPNAKLKAAIATAD
jgi:hypothetical protein